MTSDDRRLGRVFLSFAIAAILSDDRQDLKGETVMSVIADLFTNCRSGNNPACSTLSEILKQFWMARMLAQLDIPRSPLPLPGPSPVEGGPQPVPPSPPEVTADRDLFISALLFPAAGDMSLSALLTNYMKENKIVQAATKELLGKLRKGVQLLEKELAGSEK